MQRQLEDSLKKFYERHLDLRRHIFSVYFISFVTFCRHRLFSFPICDVTVGLSQYTGRPEEFTTGAAREAGDVHHSGAPDSYIEDIVLIILAN